MQMLVEGWTERIKEQLMADGVALPLTDLTVTMLLYAHNGTLVTPRGTSGIDTIAEGIVYFDPHPLDLVASQSPYSVRWKVADADGKAAFFPNSNPSQWVVKRP